MKKVLFLAAVVAFATTSCKKDYTCECTTTSTVYSNNVKTVGTPYVTSGSTGKMKKDEAKTKCEKDNGTTMGGTTTNGVSTTIDCKIK